MGKLTLDVNVFDTNSMLLNLSKIKGLERAFKMANKKALKEIEKRLKKRLIEELTAMGLGDSSLVGDIYVSYIGNGMKFGVSSNHAVFLEFGTGIAGSNNPHPNTGFDGGSWEYDVNEHGEAGWWYPTTGSDPNPTKRQLDNGDFVAWTRGHESRPFMYNTWKYARRMSPQIFTKYYNKELRRLLK